MPSDSLTPVTLVPYGEDILAASAQRIISQCGDALPQLQHVVVLLPDLRQGVRLRRALMKCATQRGHHALLGPRVETLSSFLTGLPLPSRSVIPDEARELVLMDALRRHAELFGDTDVWRLSHSLLSLFDELNLQQYEIPLEFESFQQRLMRGYRIAGEPPRHLSREAQIVHRLWLAWRTQLQDEDSVDRNGAYLQALACSLDHIGAGERFFLVGFSSLRPAEAAWVKQLRRRGQLEIILHGRAVDEPYHPGAPLQALFQSLTATAAAAAAPSDGRTAALDAVFDLQLGDLRQRAAELRAVHPQSPLAAQLRVLAAADSEQEAQAVDLQVRQWLIAGKRRIGIVTEDRRLARRVRALLERAGVALADSVGWALSTTSSATVIERWLQSVEEEFAHQPLLDLLKSPFLLPELDDAADDYRRAVYRLEQDIILHENIPRGLARYRRHLQYRERRLGWSTRAGDAVRSLLDRLEHAAAPLLALRAKASHPLDRFADALLESLSRLGVLTSLNRDAAGAQVLQLIEQLQHAARQRPVSCDWLTFRSWLGAALENHHFSPPATDASVQLLSLEQTASARFDSLVLAAAEQQFLPGQAEVSPYFNDGVRRELGLTTWRQRLGLRLHHFRRLLEAAPEVVITRRREQDGEELLPSPWLEAIQALHVQAYGDDLTHSALQDALRDPRTRVNSPDGAALPSPSANPRAVLTGSRLPETISAGAQQHLIDCPYQFFAADCLGLKPVDEIREALEKSDYGERVHRCLEAFHGHVDGLPGPFGAAVTDTNRAEAIALLSEIAQAVFAQDLEDNFIHRGWLKRWQAMIPEYIDWQLQRARDWTPTQVESAREHALADRWRLKGRLDRIDEDTARRCAVLDYKTGAIPRPTEVTAGEAVQLVSYALLLDDVAQVEYLQLDKQVKSVAVLAGEDLSDLRAAVRARLVALLQAIDAGAALPAWGDADTCVHCQMAGVCRRQSWDGPIQ